MEDSTREGREDHSGGDACRRLDNGSLVWGVILVLVGAFFLAGQLVPGFGAWVDARVSWAQSWPLIIIGVGLLQAVIGLVTRTPAMAIPTTIVTGIGALLYWQNATGNWGSWAWVWTLIPGLVGLGLLLAGLLGESRGENLRAAVILLIISSLLAGIFGSFLGGPSLLRLWWPLVLVGLGLYVLARGSRNREAR